MLHRANGGFVLTFAVAVVALASAACGPSSNTGTAPSNLTYSTNPATYTVGVEITQNTPTNSGGTATSYGVLPALPSGLNLDTTSGAISGKPMAVAAAATYMVTATNSVGSTSVGVSITVNPAAPSNLTYPSNPAVYTVLVPITSDSPHVTGTVASYTVTPALPAGLSLDPTSGVISGTPTAITAMATYTVKASNIGGSTTAGVVITVNDAAPTKLAYSANPATYTKGTAINPNKPSNLGGVVVSYSVAPALPMGLGMDTTTGIISGTPGAITATATYTVTATNTGGSATVGVSITVNDLPPTNLTYSTNPATYTKGVAIPLNNPSNTGGGVTTYAVAPALPAGLVLNTASGVISGTATVLATAANYVVTASNSVGSTTATVNITVKDMAPASLTYSSNPASYTKLTAITPNTPTSSGGVVVSYAVAPALPAGLTINGATGVISGTPTVVAAIATYTVTATNTGGTATVGVSITVKDIPPANLAYPTNPATYTKGVAIAANNPTSSGGAVVTYSVNPALPAGLAFNTSTGSITGTPTAITATATYTVTGTNTGGTATVGVSITVNDAAPTALAYSSNPAVYTKGVAITTNTATNNGGAIVTYSANPALPLGLVLNTSTGAITGTPTVVAPATSFTITGTNTGGSTTVSLSIAINDVAPTTLTYSTNPASYTKGTAIAANNPSSGGGAVVSYAVAPALPAGLALNTTTGVITGTPTVVTPLATYTVTATNTGGNATVGLNITIKDIAPTGLTYSSNPAVYTVGTEIPQNTPTNGGGAVVSYAVGTTLPAGLSLNTTTGIISGTPTVVVSATNFVITATNSGGSTAANVSITVNIVSPTRFAFVANENDNTLSVYTVEGNTGELRADGFAVTGTTPRTVTVHPTGKFVYVANIGANTISQFSVATNGQLTAIAAPIAAGTRPFAVTVDPKGKFAYAVNYNSNDVSAYTINAGTGALTSVGPTTPAGTNPSSVTVDPTGRFVYVANQGTNNVSVFSINSTTGALGSVGAIGAGTLPGFVTVDPSGRFAYVANETTNNISAFSINSSTGALTSLGAAVGAGTTPVAIAVAPSGSFAYVANTNSNSVSILSINATTGVLASVGTPATTPGPVSVTVDPSGDFVYVSNFGTNRVTAFSVNTTTGALAPLQSTGARQGATSFALASGNAPVAYTPKFAYVANLGGNNLTTYTISGGVLTSFGNPVTTGQAPSFVAVDPFGRFAYVTNESDGTVSGFTIGSSGALTPVATGGVTAPNAPTGTAPISVCVDPSGSFVYVANNVSGDVAGFTINQTTGVLTSVGANLAAGGQAFSITVDPTGQFLYTANEAGSVSMFSINPATGVLTSLGTNVSAGTNPVSVAVDSTGSFVYVANISDNDISTFSIGATGVLTGINTTTATGTGTSPIAIAIDPTSNFLYVALRDGNAMGAFSINESNGVLMPIGTTPIATGVAPRSAAVDPSGAFAYAGNSDSSANSVSAYTITATTGVLVPNGAAVPAGANPNSIAISGTIQ